MKIYKGWVVDTMDIHSAGMMWVYCPSVNEKDSIEVQYTSPFAYPAAEGGMVAFPGIDQEIFIFTPDGKDDAWAGSEWYYWGSVFGKHGPDLPTFPEVSPGESVYTPSKMKPESIVIKGPRGNQLNLTYHDDKIDSMLRSELKTGSGKTVSLIDNRKNDMVVMKNQHGDRFLLTGDPYGVRPARAAEIRTAGPQNYESLTDGIQMQVRNGKEIDIVNNSNEVGGKSWPDDPSDPEGNDEWFGNINLLSKHRDINLVVNEGRLFLTAPGKYVNKDGEDTDTPALVQIASGSSITLWADQDIGIRSLGDINMYADKSLNILAGEDINLQATNEVNIVGDKGIALHSTEGEIGIRAANNKDVRIDARGGGKIRLAETVEEAGKATDASKIKKETNHYGD